MKQIQKILPALGAALSAVCLALLLADAIWPERSLFLKPAVKWFVLVCCAGVIVGNGALAARDRRRLRRRQRRQKPIPHS